MRRPELELLAPAKSADIGVEAVNHGADAVYIGGPAFGARLNAGNALADIERLCRHAHRFGARIFITLNTILRDDELEPARRMAWDVYRAGADALIVQDMGLLEIDLPPIQLHASTQSDIRTPAKARFLQDVGFSQMVLARELDLAQIRAIASQVSDATLEFFIHGALCVAYSGQCFISHAHTGRSANRGNCSQECRLPYTVTDPQGRVVSHDRHVLSLKDNNQSANLEALVDAGIRSFKIEGRYKDLGYVKNVTAHYRQLLDAILDRRPDLRPVSSGHCSYTFAPDPDRNFNRGTTDYFVNGRRDDIGAFDTPKHAGQPAGHVSRIGTGWFEIADGPALNNSDGLTYYDLQRELVGLQVNVAERCATVWRVTPNEPLATLRDLRVGTEVWRNRDTAWDRLLQKNTAERRIGIWLRFVEADGGFALEVSDEDGHSARAVVAHARQPARDAALATATLHAQLGKLGNTIFRALGITIALEQPWFVPTGVANALRRGAIERLERARVAALPQLPRASPLEPAAPCPDNALSYLANVFNARAATFYARHGVKVVAAAYESHEERGDVSLMITKHCVRWSLSLCPKQAKGITGVQGTVRADPLTLVHGADRLTLRFDCKPCEMHVVGRIKRHVLKKAAAVPVMFHKTPRATAP